MKSHYSFLAIALLGLGAFACSEPVEPEDTTVEVRAVVLDKTTLTLHVGETATLTPAVSPADADYEFSWTAEPAGVVSVDDEGLVTALKIGEATVTVTAGSRSATCAVTVQEATVPVETVTLDQTEQTLDIFTSETKTLTATVNPTNADYTVNWTVEPRGYVRVDQSEDNPLTATITPMALGTATVMVAAGGKTATCEVTVISTEVPVESVSLDPTELTVLMGDEASTLTASVAPVTANNYTLTWSVTPEGIVTLVPAEDGKTASVTPAAIGTATVTVSTGDKTATCVVTVTVPDPVTLTLAGPTDSPVTGYTPALSSTVSTVVNVNGTYSSYELVEGTAGVYTGTSAGPKETPSEYFVFWPYDANVSVGTDGTSTTAYTVGAVTQTQAGLDNVAHLTTPLYGYTTDASTTVEMKQVATYFDVAVTNSLESAFEVTQVTLTNSDQDAMVGTFYVNAKTGELSAVGTSDEATLNVTGASVAAGTTGHFYLTCAPFELSASGTLTLTLTTSVGKFSKTVTVDAATTYASGSVAVVPAELKKVKVQPTTVNCEQQHIWGDIDNAYSSPARNVLDNNLETSWHTPWGDETWTDSEGNTQTGTVLPVDMYFPFSSPVALCEVITRENASSYNGKLGVTSFYYRTSSEGEWVGIIPSEDDPFDNKTYNEGNPKTWGEWNFGQTAGDRTIPVPVVDGGVVEFWIEFVDAYGGFVSLAEVEFYGYVVE